MSGSPAAAQLRGHGGPVRALAVAPGGALAISGGFDQAAILWAIDSGSALTVLRFHDGAVNAVAALSEGGFVTASEDGRIALWRAGQPEPERVFTEHAGPVAALAVSPDGSLLASAAWDGTARIRPIAGGPARVLAGHQGNVNAVGFLPDRRPVTAGYDATVRIWPRADDPAGVPIGGTCLFRTADFPDAPGLFDRLGAAGIYVRRFAGTPARLRFGLPPDKAAWCRLSRILR